MPIEHHAPKSLSLMNNAVTPEAAFFLADSHASDGSVLDELRPDQLRSLFGVIVGQNSSSHGLSFIEIGCAQHSTPELLIAVVDHCRDWDEFVAASKVLVHPSTSDGVAEAVIRAFGRHVPLYPTPQQYLRISLVIGLLVSTGRLSPDQMSPISTHSSELGAMTQAVFTSWREHEAAELNKKLERDQRLSDLRGTVDPAPGFETVVTKILSSPEDLTETLLWEMSCEQLTQTFQCLPPKGHTRTRIITFLLKAPDCPSKVLEKIATEPSQPLSVLMSVVDHSACTPRAIDSVLSQLRGQLIADANDHKPAPISLLRTLNRCPVLTEDQIQRVRRWSLRLADVWDEEVERPARTRRTVREVLDLPSWIQPAIAQLLSSGVHTTTADALAAISATN
jgi:hypothetical protein